MTKIILKTLRSVGPSGLPRAALEKASIAIDKVGWKYVYVITFSNLKIYFVKLVWMPRERLFLKFLISTLRIENSKAR